MTACSSSHILFRVNTSDFNVASRFCGFSSHSQMVIERHPISTSFFCSSISRSWFLCIFATQKSLFVWGMMQHPLCPCQKHPLTKIHVRYFFSTKSGCPGSLGEFSRYRNPRLHNPLRTIISGFVSFEWIAAIFLCRCSADSLSTTAKIRLFAEISKKSQK